MLPGHQQQRRPDGQRPSGSELRHEDDLGCLDGSIRGLFHHGFGLVAHRCCMVRRLYDLFHSRHPCYGSPRKVVFCGHSLGGAVAHLALIKYILGTCHQREDEFGAIAIGFGAPHIGDPSARNYLREQGVEERLFNIVTKEDPVPRLFNNLPQSVRDSSGLLGSGMNQAMLGEMRQSGKSSRHGNASELEVKESLKWLFLEGAMHFFRLSPEGVLTKVASCVTALVAAGLEVKKLANANSPSAWYVPMGQWRCSQNLKQSIGLDEAGEVLKGPITGEQLQSHRMAAYLETVLRWNKTAPPIARDGSESVQNVVVGPGPVPEIIRGFRRPKPDGSGVIVTVKGRNLEVMFLDARVGGEPVMTCDAIVLRHSDPDDPTCELRLAVGYGDHMDEAGRRRLAYEKVGVEIVTCFGQATWDIPNTYRPVREEWGQSVIAEAYFRCLCKLTLGIRASGVSGDEAIAGLWPLDKPTCSQTEKHLFQFLRDCITRNRDKPLAAVIGNELRPQVSTLLADELTGKMILEVPKHQRIRKRAVARGGMRGALAGGGAFLAIGASLSPGLVPAAIASVAVPPVPIIAGAVAGMAATGSIVTGFVVGAKRNYAKQLHRQQTFVELKVAEKSYEKSALKLLWIVLSDEERMRTIPDEERMRTIPDEELMRTIPDETSELEKEILGRSSPEGLEKLRECIRKSASRHKRVPKALAGEKDGTLTRKSWLEYVDRAAVMHDICRADEKLRTFLKVILLVGEENVGKTTLVKSILRKCGQNDLVNEMEEVGFTTHTPGMEVYRCEVPLSSGHNCQLVLVDSPGTSTPEIRSEDSLAWQCLERVPDLCFVMVRFSGDIQKQNHELAQRIAREQVCAAEKQVLFVNHMDSVLKGPQVTPEWKEYSRQKLQDMKKQYAQCSNIEEQNVLMTVFKGKTYLFDEEKRLLEERGVLLVMPATP